MQNKKLNEEQLCSIKELREECSEENLWKCIIAFQNYQFYTMKGLPYSYTVKQGRKGYTRELIVDRRKESKTLAWGSIRRAFENIPSEVVARPKALGDIRGISYIYPIFYCLGLIDVPETVAYAMSGGEIEG